MKKSILPLLLSAAVLAASPVLAEEAEAESTGLNQDVVILFTSDVHCGFDKNFTYVGLQAVRDHFEDTGCVTFLVDDGDSIQGEPIGTVTKGSAVIDLMNKIGYDVAIPGNHEFDYGMDPFLSLAKEAEFPYISCNFNKEGELVFDPYVIKEVDDTKIAFVGVTTPKTLTSSTPTYFQDENGNYVYGFMQDDTGDAIIEAIQGAVDDARAEGADYVFLMGHMGNEAECVPYTYADILEKTSGIDAMFDGHSHDYDQVNVKNKEDKEVIRCAVGTKMDSIGYLTIFAEDGHIEAGSFHWNNSIPAPELLGINNKMSSVVKEATEELDKKLGEVVAHTKYDLYINDPNAQDSAGNPIRIIRRAETNLGDLCADAFRDQGHADIGWANGGGIRANIQSGDITLGQILSVHPFGNMLCVAEVTGQQILDCLEWNSREVPGESGGFLQVSGLTYEIHTYIDSSVTMDSNGMFTGVDGEYRVKNVMVGDEPLDLEKTYTLASHDYMLINNGDGNTMFKDANFLQTSGKVDNQVLMDYITETLGGEIPDEYSDPYGQGRIVAVEEVAEKESE